MLPIIRLMASNARLFYEGPDDPRGQHFYCLLPTTGCLLRMIEPVCGELPCLDEYEGNSEALAAAVSREACLTARARPTRPK